MITLHINPPLDQALASMAAAMSKPKHAVIEQAIQDYVSLHQHD
jgi:predicted transcriptional regulator